MTEGVGVGGRGSWVQYHYGESCAQDHAGKLMAETRPVLVHDKDVAAIVYVNRIEM